MKKERAAGRDNRKQNKATMVGGITTAQAHFSSTLQQPIVRLANHMHHATQHSATQRVIPCITCITQRNAARHTMR
jgi:hypothetical protein